MTLSIRTNIASISAQTDLNRVTKQLQGNFERLSSGLRINHASDDAAGLAIADRARGDKVVYAQAVRNVNEAVSFFNVAQDAVKTLKGLISSMDELATRAANGLQTADQRASLDEEFQSLVTEYNRIVENTEFNYTSIFTEGDTSIRVQAGYGTSSTITANLTTTGFVEDPNGTFTAGTSFAPRYSAGNGAHDIELYDINNDGHLDIVGANPDEDHVFIALGNGNGTFKARTSAAIFDNLANVAVGDVNNDGIADVVVGSVGAATTLRTEVLIGNGDGSFKAAVSYSHSTYNSDRGGRLVDVNGDGNLDFASVGRGTAEIRIQLGNGNGSFKVATTYQMSGSGQELRFEDVNGDGNMDLITATETTGKIDVFLGNGNGTFLRSVSFAAGAGVREIAIGDFNNDGKFDIASAAATDAKLNIIFGNGNGTFIAPVSYTAGTAVRTTEVFDADNDGDDDIVTTYNNTVSIHLNNGNGTFTNATNYTETGAFAISIGDIDEDGVNDIAGAAYNTDKVFTYIGIEASHAKTFQVATISDLSIATAEDARFARADLEDLTTELTVIDGTLNGSLSRFSHAVSVASTFRDLYADAESQIRDVDVAFEAAHLVRNQVIQQSATAVLAQANLQPQIALDVLKGD